MNRQIDKTKSSLKVTLIELLRMKNIYQVHITELCEAANLNRSSFYRYYDDLYKLLDEIEQDYLQYISFDDFLESGDDSRSKENYALQLHNTKEHWDTFYCLWVNGLLPAKARQKTLRLIKKTCTKMFGVNGPDDKDIKCIAESLEDLAVSQIMLWARWGFPLTCEQMAEFIFRLQQDAFATLCGLCLPQR